MLPECFADEIAIDFPSVGLVVERMRDSFFGERVEEGIVRRDLLLSSREAWGGLVVPLDVPIRGTCEECGGRGETWTEPCGLCAGSGVSLFHHRLRVAVPRGVADGSKFRFRLSSPYAQSVRVEVRVAIVQ